MAKELVPHKIIIEIENNCFKDGKILYQMRENGVIRGNKFNTISIKAAEFSIPQMNIMIEKILEHTKKAERIKV
jgi:hypothetical protein